MARIANNLRNYAIVRGRSGGRLQMERTKFSVGVGSKATSSKGNQVFQVDSTDLHEFQKFLDLFQISLERREILVILRRVLKPVVAAAQSNVTKIEQSALAAGRLTTGNLYDSIGLITGKSKEFVNVQVGPRVKGKWKGYHGAFVEFGTRNRWSKRGFRGAGKPKPYIKPAFDQTYSSVKLAFEAEIARYVEKKAESLL